MAFDDVSAEAYERFMGRFSTPLSPLFAAAALDGLESVDRVLDVGCGPGMLTAELVQRLGEPGVAAADPASAFAEATAHRFGGSDVRTAGAEALPWPDATFDAALAQLVVQFMRDPQAGVGEMRRVTRPGGRVAVCMWDHGGGHGPISPFLRTAARLDAAAGQDQAGLGSHRGELAHLLREVGLDAVEEGRLSVTLRFDTFEEWWAPYPRGVGPAGDYLATLDDARIETLVEALRADLGDGPFDVVAAAWSAVGTVPGRPERGGL